MGALNVFSKFYFGLYITTETRFLNFREGVGDELSIELDVKGYTLEDMVEALEEAFNSTGALTYTVSLNRSTRIITIAASGAFTLLASTGSNVGLGAWAMIGFNAVDKTGASLASDNALGSSYAVQFPLQNYVPKENNLRALNSTVSKSASGRNVTVQTFGEERFIKFNMQYITDIAQPSSGRLRSNVNGVNDALEFLEFAIQKYPFEFMVDESDVDAFDKVILESIGQDRDGVSFELIEYYDKGLPFYFESGPMVLKVLD